MTTTLTLVYTTYRDFLEEHMDPRTKVRFFVSSPFPLIALLVAFYYFVATLGPQMMKNRKPFVLKEIMIIYNAIQVIMNAYVVYLAFSNIWFPGVYGWGCVGVDYSSEPLPLLVAHVVHFYYLMKILDLADTIFMVLRKKGSQITFLHLYHHIGMCLAGWVGTAFIAGGTHVVFLGTINCVVHVIMYSYYLLTIIKPEYRKSIFKRRITELQLAQFIITCLHAISALLETSCTFPTWVLVLYIPQDMFMFVLFWDFYVKAYLKPQKKKPSVDQQPIAEEANSKKAD